MLCPGQRDVQCSSEDAPTHGKMAVGFSTSDGEFQAIDQSWDDP